MLRLHECSHPLYGTTTSNRNSFLSNPSYDDLFGALYGAQEDIVSRHA